MNPAVTFCGKDATVEPTGIVLAACHRSVRTSLAGQALDTNVASAIGKLTQYQTSPMNPS